MRFSSETGHALPEGPTAARAAVVLHELREDWTAWKCDVIADVVRTLGDAARRGRPGAEVLINGVALGRWDYDDAVAQVLGQRLEAIGDVAEHIELMFYHQIQRREPVPWILSLTGEARQRFPGTVLACLQVKPDYLGPQYAPGRRRPTIPYEEYIAALRAVRASAADGVMVYDWVDFLEDELSGDGRRAAALRAFKDGTL
jgi:hypothetical protein